VHLAFGQQLEDGRTDVAALAPAAGSPATPRSAPSSTAAEGAAAERAGTEAETGAAGSTGAEAGTERAATLSADLLDELCAPVGVAASVTVAVPAVAGAEAESGVGFWGCEWGVHV